MRFSVIIPVYNVEKYLEKCLQSVVNQTYRDYEVILVDDGSTDLSGFICNRYENQYEFVKAYHKENGGLSSARNYGIEQSKGEYIVLIDSDDFVSKYFLQVLSQEMEKSKLELYVLKDCFNFWDGDDDNVKLLDNPKSYKSEIINSKDVLIDTLYYRFAMGAPFKICHRSLYNNIKFPEGWLYEDAATVYKFFLETVNTCVIDANLYAYRKRKSSIIRSDFSKKKMVVIDITREFISVIKNKEPENSELMRAAYDRAFSMNYSLFLQIPKNKLTERQTAWEEIKKYRFKILFNRSNRMRKKDKLAAIITFAGKDVAYYLGRKYGQKGNMY